MLNVQSTPPVPEPVESFSVVSSAAGKSAKVAAGMVAPPDQTADATATATVWVSPRSVSVKVSVPVGTGLVVLGAGEPVVSASSESEADSGPLVIWTGSLVPRIVTVTVCVDDPPDGSVTLIW